MQAQSRTLIFGLSTAVAVGAVAFISWRISEQNPRLFARSEPPRASAPVEPARVEPSPQGEAAAPKQPTAATPAGIPGAVNGAVFDIVRVEPTGEAVVAGRAQPGASVRLLNRGVEIASAKADGNGQFAIVPPPLGKGDHLLSLEADGAKADKPQTVAVAVPPDAKGDVVVALTEPGAATRILSDQPKAGEAPKPAPAASLSIRSVEVDDAGGFYATGAGAPGSTIRLSLNGSPVTTVKANDEGRWSLKVEKGMNPGAYSVRADHLDDAGHVVAQAEVPFNYPARTLAAATPGAGGPATGADAVVRELQSVTVQRGDSLWRISQRTLGNGLRYTQIYQANANKIRNPSLIYPNQILVMPQADKAAD